MGGDHILPTSEAHVGTRLRLRLPLSTRLAAGSGPSWACAWSSLSRHSTKV